MLGLNYGIWFGLHFHGQCRGRGIVELAKGARDMLPVAAVGGPGAQGALECAS